MTRRALLAGALILAVTLSAQANPLHFGGHPQAGNGETPISSLLTTSTAATTAFLASCPSAGVGPLYPPQWDYDPAKILGNQPQAATEAMGLTPKVEQYDVSNTLVRTWNHLVTTPGCGTADCQGPFSAGSDAAWRKGDKFLVYPAVYKEATRIEPVPKVTSIVALTAGSTTVTVPDATNIAVGDPVVDPGALAPIVSPYITRLTFVTAVAGNLVTVNNPWLANTASHSILFVRNVEDITIQGVTQNVAGVPTRPVIMYDETANMSQFISGFLQIASDSYYDANISNVLIKNIDVAVKPPPYGQQTYFFSKTPFILIRTSGIEYTGPVTFEDMRISGAMFSNGGNGGMGMHGDPMGAVRGSTGTVTINRTEWFNNGGLAGPAHHVYLDPANNLVQVTNSYFHHVVNGHHLKLRGANNLVKGNYFEGGLFAPFNNFGESNLIDAPCGGNLTAVDNIFVKSHNLSALNPVLIEYYEDPQCIVVADGGTGPTVGSYTRAQAEDQHIEIRNNTFVSFSKRAQGGAFGNANAPFTFQARYPRPRALVLPGEALFPTSDVTIKNNVFVGFCPASEVHTDYPMFNNSPTSVGPNLVAAFSDIDQNFALVTNLVPQGDTGNLNEIEYIHRALSGVVRAKNTFGAIDQDATATPSPPSAPEVVIYASPPRVGSGSTTVLHWFQTGGTSCIASGGWSGTKSTVGGSTEVVTPISSVETDYTISCSNGAGQTGTDTVAVQAIDPPTFAFTSDVTSTSAPGQPVNFIWTSANSDNCVMTYRNVQGQSANGTFLATPAQTTTYTLFCQGVYTQYPTFQSIKITVNSGGVPTTEFPTVYLWSDPNFMNLSGTNVGTLHWMSWGTTSCTGTVVSGPAGTTFNTGGATSGSIDYRVTSRADFTISCVGPGGTTDPLQVPASIFEFP